ncbi:MAG: Endopolyphosphatase [Piccolia ochrophora]|nr:MAG: Endopolyphosphatase [Piccolia ochrophora]
MRGFASLILGLGLAHAAAPHYSSPSRPISQDLESSTEGGNANDPVGKAERKLHGRFLHITDLHPDPFYKRHSSTNDDDVCHRGSGTAGLYGASATECDSPFALVNATFKWVEENLKDSVDFVIWTGDSARHDNDEKIPRKEKQVLDLNRYVVDKLVEVFGKSDNINDTDPTNDLIIPIVPTFGNNDILPHNVFEQGPNEWTRKYLHIWRHMIPEEQRHSFERGGWFFVEVIPNQLAVFSLNTLYFFDNNAAVDGCSDSSEPGYEHFEWLRIQLQFLRERGMKAILMGHVPPARTKNKYSWDETCWQRYTLWMRQYRDVVVGSLYGHMNLDHFMLQDSDEVDINMKTGFLNQDKIRDHSDDINIQAGASYLQDLQSLWSNTPGPPPDLLEVESDNRNVVLAAGAIRTSNKKNKKKRKKSKKEKYFEKIGGEWGERYSLALISGSVIPEYFPSLRVIEYNTSGINNVVASSSVNLKRKQYTSLSNKGGAPSLGLTMQRPSRFDKLKKHRKPKKPRKPHFTVPEPPSSSSPPGPAYSPQTFSWLGYTQYLANLTSIYDEAFSDSLETGDQSVTNSRTSTNEWRAADTERADVFQQTTKTHPRPFRYEIEYKTFNDSSFSLPDLTVSSYLKLAWRIGNYESTDMLKASRSLGQHLEEEEDDDDDGCAFEDDVSTTKKGHKKHKKQKKKHRKRKRRKDAEEAWIAFVQRAFIGSRDPDDIWDRFGIAKGDVGVTNGVQLDDGLEVEETGGEP